MHTPRPRRPASRGHAAILICAIIIPLACLGFFVGNSLRSERHGEEAQSTADQIAMTVATLLDRGLNRLAVNNQRIALLEGLLVVARATPKALSDCIATAWLLAAANWWNGLGEFYAEIATNLSHALPVVAKACAAIAKAAELGIAKASADNVVVLGRLPRTAAIAGHAAALAGGAKIAVVLPAQPSVSLGAEVLPSVPVAIGTLADTCTLLEEGSPRSAHPDARRVFAAQWGWPAGQGTVEYFASHLGMHLMFAALAPVGGPSHFRRRLDEATRALCEDRKPGPAVFPGGFSADPATVLRSLRYVVITVVHAKAPVVMPMMEGGRIFDDDLDVAIGSAEVELVTDVSVDSTSASWRARLTLGTDIPAALARVAAGTKKFPATSPAEAELLARVARISIEELAARGGEVLH